MKKRICALLTILIIIGNMFSPYGVLINTSYAKAPAEGEPYYKLQIRPIDDTADEDDWTDETWYYYYDYYQGNAETRDDYTGTRVITIDLKVEGASTVNAGDINLKYDNSKLIPVQETYSGSGKNKKYWIEEAQGFENPNSKSERDFATINWGTPATNTLDTTTNVIRTGGAVAAGETYVADGEIVGTFMFKLADGLTLSDLTTDTFTLIPTTGLGEGLQLAYYSEGKQMNVKGSTYLLFDGFAAGAKKITGMTLVSNMTKIKYYVGEELDYTGLSVKILYDDGTEEIITDVKSEVNNGTFSVDSTKATSNKKLVLTTDDITLDIPYNIVTNLRIDKNPTNTTYDHDDTLSFTGGIIKIIYDNGDTENLGIEQAIAEGKLTVNQTKADVNNSIVTFTYIDKISNVDLPLIVNDPIDNIVITKMPTKVEYNHDEKINVAGGVIKAVKRSGAEISNIPMTDTKVSILEVKADINACGNKWQNGDLTAGNQDIHVTYEGKSTKYNVVVNDTIDSISIKTNPSSKNKYGTQSGALNLTGATLEVISASGNKFDVNITLGMIDLTSYNPNTLDLQNLSVTYAGKVTTEGAGIEIKLLDYITGIKVNTPSNFSANYDTEIDLSNVTYIKNYASGAVSASLPVAIDMISGYNKKPAANSFNVAHECEEVVKVTLAVADDIDIDKVPAEDTFKIKVKDIINGIEIAQRPNKVVYNYGEIYSSVGGRVTLSYASGNIEISGLSMTDSKIKVTEMDGSQVNTQPIASEFTNGKVNRNLKVTYTDGNVSYDTNMQITINDVLESIQIGTMPNLTFNHGDTFNTDNGKLKVIYKSQKEEVIDLSEAVLTETLTGTAVNMSPAHTEYTNNELIKNITVSYTERNVTETTNYDITLRNIVDTVVIGTSPKISYNLNESIVGAGGILVVTRKAGNTENVNITDDMISGLDTSSAGIGKTATITYTEGDITKNINYNYDVKDNITEIIITKPTKNEYKHGEALDLAGGNIQIKYASGTIDIKSITEDMIKESNGSSVNMSPSTYDSTNKVSKTLKISYTIDGNIEEIGYDITIINDIKSIKVHSTNHKTEYSINEPLDVTDLTILVTRATGIKEVIEVTESMVSNFESTQVNLTLPLTITYEENGITKTTTYNVEINNSVTGIVITKPTKSEYNYGEALDFTGGNIEISYSDGTKQNISITESMTTESNGNSVDMRPNNFDNTNKISKTLKISYTQDGKTQEIGYDITIINNIKLIEVYSTNHKTAYSINDQLDTTNLTILVTREVGIKEVVNVTDSMVSGFASNVENARLPLTITYEENGITKTTSYNVSVNNNVSSIQIKKPTKETYKHGENLLLSGGEIILNYADGQTGKADINEAVVKESDGSNVNMSPASYDTTNKVTKTLKISYTQDGKTGEVDYPITIINDIKLIEVYSTNHKTLYNVNDVLDVTNLEILVTRAVGTKEVIKVTNDMVSGFASDVENTKLPLTITYEENGITETTIYNVVIQDNVTKIEIEADPKKKYKYNEELDLLTGSIKVTKGSGKETIPLSNCTVTGYNKETVGEQELTITYGGKNVKYKVTVKDYVTGIKISPNPVKGSYGTELSALINDNNIMYTVNYAKEGEKITEALLESMVLGYNKESTKAQSLEVKYTDNDLNSYTNGKEFTGNLDITFENTVSTIIITKPTKNTYNYGESLELSEGEIILNYTDGQTGKVDIANSTITEIDGSPLDMRPSSFDSTNKITKTLKITYTQDGKTGEVDYPITIINDIKSIEVSSTNHKIEYNVNDELDIENLEILVTRAVGTKEVIEVTDDMVSGFSSVKENTKLPLTITYEENGITKTTSYNISVTDSVLSIEIDESPKTQYKYGESLDVNTGTLIITRSSGTETITIEPSMVTETNGRDFDGTILGTRNLKLTYRGQTIQYEVTVSDYIKDIIFTPPTKVEYECKETLDLEGGKIQKIMASGAVVPDVLLSDKDVELTGYDLNVEGTQTVIVKYGEFTDRFGIIVSDNVQTIVMKETPKTDYRYGESLDITGGEITATKSSGVTQNIPLTLSMVKNYKPNELGEQVLIVEYKGKTTSYKVNIEDYVKDIEITKPDKLVYTIGDIINLTGGTVKKIMASGQETNSIDMSDVNVTVEGFDTNAEGQKLITITYEGFTKTFNITVIDEINDIRIKTLPDKLDYEYDEELDLKGGTIEIVKTSGNNQIINITKDMVSGYDPKKVGEQTVTINYTNPETGEITKVGEFTVNIEDYVSKLNIIVPNKIEYEYGEDLELTGGKVQIIMASGDIKEEAEMTASMLLTIFDPQKVGTQIINIKYKDLNGNFKVEVVDKVKGISLESKPDKLEYEYGEQIDVTGGTLKVIKSSGISIIQVTIDMITGYDSTISGEQVVTVNYEGFTAKFIVKVGDRPYVPDVPEEPVEPNIPEEPVAPNEPNIPGEPMVPNEPEKPEKKPQMPSVPNKKPQTNFVEVPIPEKEEVVEKAPIVQETPKEPEEQKPEEPKYKEEKPTATLGVKDKNEPSDKLKAGITSLIGLMILLLLILNRRNTKIYVEENGKFSLGGALRLTKRRLSINIDDCLHEGTYLNRVKIHLNNAISEKLDGREIEIKHRGISKKYKVEYKDEPYEIVLE